MKTKLTDALLEEVEALKPSQQRVVLDFVHFLRIRATIDPSQAYFWTREWQRLERAADRAKIRRQRFGDGTVKGLLKALKSRP